MSFEYVNAFCQEQKVKLVAVSKTRTVKQILKLYNQGQRDFGENRVQEWLDKKDQLPDDIRWHLIGNLQRKKVKSIIQDVHCIHSLDNFRLVRKVQEDAEVVGKKISGLLQFKLSDEESKSGFIYGDVFNEHFNPSEYPNLNITGVMGMATFTDKKEVVRNDFKKLKTIFDDLKSRYYAHDDGFKNISMGMSGDYKLAVEEGSNMIRIGSLLFNDLV